MTPTRLHPSNAIPCRQACRAPATGKLLSARGADPRLMVQLTSPMPPEPGVTSTVIRRAAQLPRTWAALKAPPSS